jgi:hypothetical protein
MHTSLALALLVSLFAVRPQARQTRLCADAVRYLSEEVQLAVKAEPDTINDFRTGGKHAGCRVTAAGLTRVGLAVEAVRFYERIRQNGWARTPEPWDAPREASLRFRRNGSDCLFHLYEGALLLTEAERQVSAERVPAPGQSRYGVFVMCVPVLPAKSRS